MCWDFLYLNEIEKGESMNLVITGANGFIGIHLINELLKFEEYHITALVRIGSNKNGLPEHENLSVVEIDYAQEKTKNVFFHQEICIHLIGKMGEYGITRNQFEDINVNLTMKILEWSEQAGIRQFIFCSTPGVQGFGHRLAVEEEKYAPRNLYEMTKVEAEKKIIYFCQNANIKYTILRPDFVYGPGDRRRAKMYRNIKKKRFVLTTNGKAYLNPTYITDITQGFIKSIDNRFAYDQIFNLSADKDITALEYLTVIAECAGSKLIHINIGYKLSHTIAAIIEGMYDRILRKDGFVSKNKIDFLAIDHSTSIEKAKKIIGFAPEYSIRDGMKKTIEWCEKENLLE